eukprot:6325102-Amphidinium_carterae.1
MSGHLFQSAGEVLGTPSEEDMMYIPSTHEGARHFMKKQCAVLCSNVLWIFTLGIESVPSPHSKSSSTIHETKAYMSGQEDYNSTLISGVRNSMQL